MSINSNVLEVQGLLDKVNATLAEQITLYNKLAETTSKYGSSKSTTPSSIVNIQKETEAVNASIEKTRLAEIRLQQQREKAFDKYEAQLAKNIALESRATEAQIKASEKIIAQKEKEFAKFEKEFNKYEADLAKKSIKEEEANQRRIRNAEAQRISEIKQYVRGEGRYMA